VAWAELNRSSLLCRVSAGYGNIHTYGHQLAVLLQVQPHSCRTGAAIMLQGQGMDGPVQMPFKIR
jgi:hypothetical protein